MIMSEIQLIVAEVIGISIPWIQVPGTVLSQILSRGMQESSRAIITER